MRDRASAEETTVTGRLAEAGRSGFSQVYSILAALVLIGAATGVMVARVNGGPQFDGLLMIVIGATSGLLALIVIFRNLPLHQVLPDSQEPLKHIFDSAGPMMIAIGMDGSITHMNPAAERLLGYHESELVGQPRTAEIQIGRASCRERV